MKLPGSAAALVEERKVRDYLLNAAHPDGVTKARFFARRGYRLDEWESLAEDLRRHGQANDVVDVVDSPYGTRYAVEGTMRTPSDETVPMTTVWIIEKGSQTPRLVTAYPA